jgi:exosortase
VVEECSGFSALYAAVTVAFVLAYLSRSRARRIVLVLVAWPLALAGNVLRIVALAILAESRGFEVISTPLHLLSGYLSFVLTLFLVFAFAEPRPGESRGLTTQKCARARVWDPSARPCSDLGPACKPRGEL